MRIPFDVVALGALNVDLIDVTTRDRVQHGDGVEDSELESTAMEIDERIRREKLSVRAFLGGSAFNAVTMLAQLKLDSVSCGMVGVSSDSGHGVERTHRQRLADLHIVDMTLHTDMAPGLCLSKPAARGRKLLPVPEANLLVASQLTEPSVMERVSGSRILHVTSLLEDRRTPPGETPILDSVANFVRECKRRNPKLIISFDPGEPWIRREGLPSISYLLEAADVLFLNDREFDLLSKSDLDASYSQRSLRDYCPNGTTFILKRLEEIIIQLPTGFDLDRVRRPLSRNEAVDPTGAGDAVAAGVLAALADGHTLVEGCELGLRLAKLRVSAYGDLGHRTGLHDKVAPVWGRKRSKRGVTRQPGYRESMKPDDFLPGWGHTDPQLQVLFDMDAIYNEAKGAQGPRVDLGGVIGERESGRIDDPGRARLKQYERYGWLRDLVETFDPGGVDAELSADGLAFVEEIRRRRGSALMRRRGMRQSVAIWILEQHAEGQSLARYGDFLGSRYALWYGSGPITAEEYGAATYWLRDAGFAEGSAAQGHGLIAIKLTPLGESLVDAGRDLNDVVASALHREPASATSYVTSIVSSPGAAVAAGSADVKQQTNVTITEQIQTEAEGFATLLERLLPEVNPDVDAQQVAINVRTAAASGDPRKFRAALTGAQMAFAAAIGTDGGNALWEAAKPLLRHAGMG